MKTMIFALLSVLLFSCSSGPQAINYGKDACDFCKMTIMDERFSAECISTKGKVYKFDDAHCLLSFLHMGGVWSNEIKGVYFSDFTKKPGWINSDNVLLLKSESLRSPMGGNVAAFSNVNDRAETMKQFSGQQLSWKELKESK
jgi:copper chaperone NosL